MWSFSSIISGKYRRTVNTLKHCLVCESLLAVLPSLLASTSLWPWQDVHRCEGRVQKGRKAPKWGKLSALNEMRMMKWWKWHLKWALIFYLFFFYRRGDVCGQWPLRSFRVVLFFGAESNERTQQRRSQQWSFSTDLLHDSHFNNSMWRHWSADASTLPSWSLFYWARLHTRFPLSVLYSLSEWL